MDPIANINMDRAFEQWLMLYNELAIRSLIYVLPSDMRFQDQAYVSNLACYLPHKPNLDVILLSNYQSPPRIGEEQVGEQFFRMMGYNVYKPPTTWEGEADLKYLYDNIYIGGYGQRSDYDSFEWMERNFDMEIVKIRLDDPKAYHLDCSVFPLTRTDTLVATRLFDSYDIRKIEKVTSIIDIPAECVYDGWTNSLKVGTSVYTGTWAGYPTAFEKILDTYGFSMKHFDLSEFEKSGAALSCLVMHLSYV